MRIHWHTEASEHSLLRHFVSGCLGERCGHLDSPDVEIHSWGPPHGPLPFLQYPDGRPGNAMSWKALTEAVRPDLQVVLRPEFSGGATLSLGDGGRYPEERYAFWTWTEAAGDAVPEAWGELPHAVLYPRVKEGAERRPPRRVEGGAVGVVPDGERLDGWERWVGAARSLREELPDLRFKLLLDPSWLQGRWEVRLNGPQESGGTPLPLPLRLDLTGCEWVVFTGREIDWGPAVLQALEEQRHVVVPEGAAASEYLERERGHFWRPGESLGAHALKSLLALLQAARADPAAWEARARRASAWSRRWSPAREEAKLRSLLGEALRRQGRRDGEGRREEGSQDSGPRTFNAQPIFRVGKQPVRWALRREIGIGDIVFAVSVAWAVKRRDPGCEVTFHTAPQHAEWVRWFPFLAAVTTGEFSPDPGVRMGDFEAQFPSPSPLDRTLALGRVIGVEPKGWTPPPQIPAEVLAQAKELLGPGEGLRIAFVARSRGGSEARSLPPAVAEETGRQLSALGEVVWLDEAPRLSSPCLQPHNHRTLHPTTDLTGRLTLPQAVAVLSLCDLCVSVDTGLLHLAVTLRKPVVGLFSHIGALQRLWLAPSFLALQPSLPCAPCGEGAGAFHCRRSGGASPGFLLPCVSLLQPPLIGEAAEEALTRPGRRVWNLAPDGGRTVWEVDAVPAPWASLTKG